MNWEAHYFDSQRNREEVSRSFSSREFALQHACDLVQNKCIVRYVGGPNGERIEPPAIEAWCKAHRTARQPR